MRIQERKPGDEFESRGVNGHLYWRRVSEFRYQDGTYGADVLCHSENCGCWKEPWEYDPEGAW